MGLFWTEDEVDSRMEKIMVKAFHDVMTMSDNFDVPNRIAAYMLAIDRVAQITRMRGIYA
jgi:glutamate dehydrogenase (NAD(P)+)